MPALPLRNHHAQKATLKIMLILLFHYVHCDVFTVDLATVSWRVSNENKSIQLSARVPGCVHTDLFGAGIIEDPYLRQNDLEQLWISLDNWTYTTVVNIPSAVLSQPTGHSTLLIFNGLDTIADVYFNDVHVGSSSNMHLPAILNISNSLLRQESNEIAVKFFSPVVQAQRLSDEFEGRYGYDVPPKCAHPVQHGQCHVNFLRKMATSFSWDWAPAFPTMGIWKSAELRLFQGCILHQFSALPILKNDWQLHVIMRYYCHASLSLNVSVTGTQGTRWSRIVKTTPGLNELVDILQIPKSSVQLWWPAGYGEQTLYMFTGRLSSGDGDVEEKRIEVGFRTVHLMEPEARHGRLFYFSINGVAVFLKGANWVPPDSFPSRVDNAKVKYLLDSSKRANMNVLRVWGGGLYESDFFYEQADRLGLLVWQDFLFACSLYPSNPEFLKSVKEEVAYQTIRLRHHASILVWSGNNENELGVVSWFHGRATYDQYLKDYISLYRGVIENSLEVLDLKSRPYILSSPTNGQKSYEAGGVSRDPNENLYGDIHFHSPNSDMWSTSVYPLGRCVSEYGFQSLPFLSTMVNAGFSKENLTYFSGPMLHRQHHPLFQGAMRMQVANHFPPIESDDYWPWQFLTQAYQAVSYKTAFELWRRSRDTFDQDGSGGTMCAIYWQLNDIWQAPSWSTIDYDLNWKMSHYYVKNAFAPLLPVVHCSQGPKVCKVYAVSDLGRQLSKATVRLRFYSWNSAELPCTIESPIDDIDPYSAALVYTAVEKQCVFSQYDVVSVEIFGENYHGSNWLLLKPNLVHVNPTNFGRATVDTVVRGGDDRHFVIQLSSSTPVAFVWLSATNTSGYFDDNGFLLLKSPKLVNFTSDEHVELATLKNQLRVTSLIEVYTSHLATTISTDK